MKLSRFEQHVRAHQDRLYAFACYLLRDAEEAQDVTQEVLLRFWQHRAELDEERLLGWLLRVARNACIDAVRRRKAYRRVVDADGEHIETTANDEPAADAVVEAAQFNDRLAAALDRLAEPYRSIVTLREIQELKYDEISDALGLPLNTVKVYLHRGRRMLREELGAYDDHATHTPIMEEVHGDIASPGRAR